MNKQHGSLKKYIKSLFCREVLVCVLNGLIVTFLMESICRQNPLKGLEFIITRPHAFLYNALIVLLTLIPAFFVRRRRFYHILVSVLWLVLAGIDCVTRIMRITPFTAYDLVIFVNNFDITNSYVTLWQIALIVVAVAGICSFLVWLFCRCPMKARMKGTGTVLLQAVVLLLLASSAPYIAACSDYSESVKAYNNYGFAYSFIRSIFDRGVEKPEVYNEEVIDEILEDMGEKSEPEAEAKDTPNVIFLQLESFYNPEHLKNVTCSENPVPNITELKKNCSTGLLTVPSIGGGTSNVEFEVLTGMNLLDFGTGEYPYSTILKTKSCETLAYDLREQGYTAHALHNYTATFYDRNQVYSMLGFDTFTTVEYMNGCTYNSLGWCRDEVLTKYILAALESTEGRDFVFTVTVQGHGNYPSDAPETPYAITSTGLEADENLKNEFEYYINQLHETDAFVGELIAELKNYDEPVIVVIYGDHLPALAFDETELDTGSLLKSEYIIWSNDETFEKQDEDLYAYQLGAEILERMHLSGGVISKFHQQCRNSENYLADLAVLEYDVLYGDSLLYEGENVYEKTELHMGVLPITIDRASYDGDRLVVRGQNFTRYSVLQSGGEDLNTTFVDSGTLVAKSTLLSSVDVGDSITVSQISGDGTVLSISDSVICEGE